MDYKTSIQLNLSFSECNNFFVVYCNKCKLDIRGIHTKSLNLEILKNSGLYITLKKKEKKSGTKFQEKC